MKMGTSSSSLFSEFGSVPYTQTLVPDGLSGIVFALEGVQRVEVLLNGPTGCKYYHSSVSDNQSLRQFEFDPLNYPLQWYFGQPRVPCTYLDNSDYVYGSEEKLASALDYFGSRNDIELLCIVNSPGAALIGDDLEGIALQHLGDKPFMTVETPGFSTDVCIGHQTGARTLIEHVAVPAAAIRSTQSTQPLRVNVLGFSLFQRNIQGDVEEFTRLLELLGLEVGCVLCAGCTLDDIRTLDTAALNIVVHPEYGLDTARLLEERFGTPYYVCAGAPIGFSATEKLARDVAGLLGVDPSPVLDECRQARRRAYSFISRLNSITGLPKGVTFAAEGTCSELYALTSFLVRYLALVPVALSPIAEQSDCYREALEELLGALGFEDVLVDGLAGSRPELLFGNGTSISQMRMEGHVFSGIETALPSMGYYDVIPKTFLGINGALLLVEMVLNGLLF